MKKSITILMIAITTILANLAIISPINAEAFIECLPAACQGTYQDENGNTVTRYEPDFSCATKRITDPTADCCMNRCRTNQGGGDPVAKELQPLFSFFNTTVAVRGERVPALINLAISTFLGIMSVYALIMGAYIGGYKRAGTTDATEIETYNKTLRNLILGFILAWSTIFIIQIVASLLGLGSLSDLTLIGNDSNPEIVIQ